MALWTGYIALGNYSVGVFTELSGGNYARKAWSFDPTGIPGVIAGTEFTKADFGVGPYSFNAMAFFAATSGGSAVFIYPLVAAAVTPAGNSLTVHAANVWIDYVNGKVRNGVRIGPGLVGVFLQTDPSALPPGAPYNNGNVQCFA